ncbi:MAG: dephospho-CoA kinase [Candidatus Hydrogenedentes bacterium]|nr:dephospho-CoA kinase [Candidatus Hydrogenedentota bacterium]
MELIGLTGGTGSGKSEVAKRLAHHGIPVIDADKIGHEVIAPGGAAAEAVQQAFGDAILTDDIIDRDKLGRHVFGNPEALRRLNAIVHPTIIAFIGGRCAKLAENGHETIVIDAALIGDNGRRDEWLSGLILVLAPEEVRIDRLVRLRGMDPGEAARRVEVQVDPETKRALADWVIRNEGTLEQLHETVDQLVRELHEPSKKNEQAGQV